MISNYAPSLPEQSETVELHRSLRLWAFSFLLIAGISMYGEDAWDFAWGVAIIIAFLITLKFKSPAMFIVFAVIMGWSAVLSALSVLFGEGTDKLWYAVGLVQTIWTAFAIRQYQKYHHLRAENESKDLDWFIKGSSILALVLMIFAGAICQGLFSDSPSPTEEAQNTTLEQSSPDYFFISTLAAVDLAALNLGLSLVVILREKESKEKAMLGMWTSIVFLAAFLVVIILGGILSIIAPGGN